MKESCTGFQKYITKEWPEITDKMAANSISYAHNELILRNQDGGYYTVFYYRQYKIDATMKYRMICMFHPSTNSITYLKI
jgi:hypothetical protein